MELVLLVAALGFLLVNIVCSIMILIHAFKNSVGQGFLCLCVPCYIIYYMFSEFEHPQKGLIIAGYWVGAIAGNVLRFAAEGMAGPSYGGGGYGGGGYGY